MQDPKNKPASGKRNFKSLKEQENLKEMSASVDKLQKDLQEKIEYLYEKGKEAEIDVNLFFSQGGLISNEEIEKYRKSKNELENYLNLISQNKQEAFKASIKSPEKKSQERRDKTRGMRKKWIPML